MTDDMQAGILSADTACACSVSPAVNFNDRRTAIDMLMLHYTGMEDGEKAQRWLCMEKSEVSCHYIIHEDGRIVQMVAEDKRAWHAGAGIWQGREDINSRSIGIEIVNPGHELGYRDFPDIQIEAVRELCADILVRHVIEPRNVVAHSDTAPGRKRDPGERFPWKYLFEQGIGHWVEPAAIAGGRFLSAGDEGPPVLALQEMLGLYGYGLDASGAFDKRTRDVVMAFQMHFRQKRVDGIADRSTIDTLYRLLGALNAAETAV